MREESILDNHPRTGRDESRPYIKSKISQFNVGVRFIASCKDKIVFHAECRHNLILIKIDINADKMITNKRRIVISPYKKLIKGSA